MAGSPGTRLAPDPPEGPREALVIATTSYQDPDLRQLRAPARDADELATIARQAAFAGERIFAPAGAVVFLMGIAMMTHTDWGWGKFWVVVGLLGYVSTFTTGVAVLSPMARRINALVEEKGATAPETQAAIRKTLLIARFDVAVLLIVIADMVTKPFS